MEGTEARRTERCAETVGQRDYFNTEFFKGGPITAEHFIFITNGPTAFIYQYVDIQRQVVLIFFLFNCFYV